MRYKLGYLFIFFSCLLLSCEQDSANQSFGKIKFGIAEATNSGGRVNDTYLSNLASVLVSIEDINGTEVVSDETLQLVTFGDSYLSEQLQLAIGSYKLTKFILLDEDGTALAACPVEGSPMAAYVEDPLPIEFEVTPGETTTVNPEVVPIGEDTSPADFGYVEFGFNQVMIIERTISVVYEENGQHVPVAATLEVSATSVGSTWNLDFEIPENGRSIWIKGGHANYEFTVQKNGFLDYYQTLSGAELVAAADTITIVLEKNPQLQSFRVNLHQFGGISSLNTSFTYQPNGALKEKVENWDDYGLLAKVIYTYSEDGTDLVNLRKQISASKTELNRDENNRVAHIKYMHTLYANIEFSIELEYEGDVIIGATVVNITSPEVPHQVYTYEYDEQGRVIGFETHISTGELLYSGEFEYSDMQCVIPAGYFDEWLTKTQTHYTHLAEDFPVIIPSFIIEGCRDQLSSYSFLYYSTANQAQSPTLDYALFETTLNAGGYPDNLKVRKTNHESNPLVLLQEFSNFQY